MTRSCNWLAQWVWLNQKIHHDFCLVWTRCGPLCKIINRVQQEKKNSHFVIVQAPPLGCQEIRDHERLSIAFWFGGWMAVLMTPPSCSFIVLKEYGLVMCHKDKGTWIEQMSWRDLKGIPIGVPQLELHFVIHPSINEGLSIGHNVVSLMPVNIHAIFLFAVAPLQLCKPSLCCCCYV